MQRRVKERLIGAAVLVMLAVIFIPMVLDDSTQTETEIKDTNIPERPDDDFNSRIVPRTDQVGTPVTSAPAGVPDNLAREEAGTEDPEPAVLEDEPVETAQTPLVEQAQGRNNVGMSAWVVQLGSFTSEENANRLNLELRDAGFSSFVEPLKQSNKVIYRVRVGPELMRSDAQRLKDELEKKMNLDSMILSYP